MTFDEINELVIDSKREFGEVNRPIFLCIDHIEWTDLINSLDGYNGHVKPGLNNIEVNTRAGLIVILPTYRGMIITGAQAYSLRARKLDNKTNSFEVM